MKIRNLLKCLLRPLSRTVPSASGEHPQVDNSRTATSRSSTMPPAPLQPEERAVPELAPKRPTPVRQAQTSPQVQARGIGEQHPDLPEPSVEDRPAVKASSIPEPVPISEAERAPASLIPVVIGLDFGTFSTKVVARRRNERIAVVMQLDEACPGYPCFVIPSLIRLKDGQVFFGRCAAQVGGGQLFRSLKVSLLTGTAGRAGDNRRDGVSPDHLVAMYLAWVLGRVRQWLDSEYGPDRTNVFVNAAAPMDHYETPELRARYLRIVNCAWNAVWGPKPLHVEQGMSQASIWQWVDDLLQPEIPIEPSATRRFDVLPETVAPIVSLSHNPRMREGMYLIVDMGAGTTEFSINHAPQPGGNRKILCYYDQSVLLGAEQFNSPPPGASEESLASSLLTSLCRTWGRGYIKDSASYAARHRWRELTVLLAGGGTSRPGLRAKIAQHQKSVMYAFQACDSQYSVATHVPADLDFRGLEGGRSDAFLLSVAHGLSFPRRTWPEFFEPNQIEHIEGLAPAAKPDLPWFEVG